MLVNRRFSPEILCGKSILTHSEREVVHVTRRDDASSGAPGRAWSRMREEAEKVKEKEATDAKASHISCPE